MPEDAKTIIIGNPGDLTPPHICTSIESIHQIELSISEINGSIVNLAASMQEHNARIEEHMRRQEQLDQDHSDRLRMLEHNCNREERWLNLYKMIEALTADLSLQKSDLSSLRKDVERHHTEAQTANSIYEPYKGAIFVVVTGALLLVIGFLFSQVGIHQ